MTDNNTPINQEDLKVALATYLKSSDPKEKDKDIDDLTELMSSLNKDLDEVQSILDEHK